MRKRHVLFLLIALLGLAAPRWAVAQRISSPYRFVEKKKDLGIFVGYMFADQGAARLGAKAGALAGAEFNIRVSAPIAIGFSAAYFPSERDVVDPAAEEESQRIAGVTDLNLLLLAGRLKLQLTGSRTWRRLVPYVYGGIGIAIDFSGSPSCLPGLSDHPDCQLTPRERFDFGSSFLAQVGFGLIWLPRQKLGLRVTFDNSLWKLTTPDGFYDETSTLSSVPSASDWTNNLQLTTGLFFWF